MLHSRPIVISRNCNIEEDTIPSLSSIEEVLKSYARSNSRDSREPRVSATGTYARTEAELDYTINVGIARNIDINKGGCEQEAMVGCTFY